jgi:uncharacterized membrane protein YeaQ/YmgE (transglycosylase-associated protein family)
MHSLYTMPRAILQCETVGVPAHGVASAARHAEDAFMEHANTETHMDNRTEYWIWFLVMGAVIGWLAGIIMRGRGFGLFGDIVVGVVGAALGGWIANTMGLYASSAFGAFLVALGGAVLLVALTRFVKRLA